MSSPIALRASPGRPRSQSRTGSRPSAHGCGYPYDQLNRVKTVTRSGVLLTTNDYVAQAHRSGRIEHGRMDGACLFTLRQIRMTERALPVPVYQGIR